jgi:hypothetical protein
LNDRKPSIPGSLRKADFGRVEQLRCFHDGEADQIPGMKKDSAIGASRDA